MAAYALESELISREPIQRKTIEYFVMHVVRKGGKIGEVGAHVWYMENTKGSSAAHPRCLLGKGQETLRVPFSNSDVDICIHSG